MHFDLLTLYYLAIGTLLLSAGLTLWERQAHPQRGRELRIAATGYVVLAIGCGLATIRSRLPGASGAMVGNMMLTTGYLVVLHAVALMNGRAYRHASIGLLVGLAIAWAIAGTRWEGQLWNHLTAVPIALVCGLTAWEVRTSHPLRGLRSRHIFVAVSGGHALFYAARACILPLFGADALAGAATATMYEGVLYSVGLPMALLGMVREEAHDRVLGTARTDYLTGLANRRWFFEHGGRVIRDAPDARAISLLAFDLDHFKSINDRFGHAAGDDILKLFAQAVQDQTGAEAVLGRIGGEEFAALLPGCDGQHAVIIGQAIAATFRQAVAACGHYGGLDATVSIGVAEHPCDGGDLGELLSAADQALYAAKARGRDRIELATPPRLALAS